VEEALEAAVESGDYSVIEKLLAVLSTPFAHTQEQTDFCSVRVETNASYRTYCGT